MVRAAMIRILLKKLNKTFNQLVTAQLEGIGLSAPQILVLRQIDETPKTIGQISKAVDLSYSTISGIIDRLENQNLVVRQRDETDRRVVWIQKTNKIEEIKQKLPAIQDYFYTQLFEGVSDEEMDHIVQTLQTLVAQLEKKVEEK